MQLEIQKINVKARMRPVTDARVGALINSIVDVGLLNPVTVVKEMVIKGGHSVDGYTLVAGAHRLEAMRRTGHTTIRVTVVDLDEHERRLAECDENLCGSNLGCAERAMLTAHRKECYEFMHPETVLGENQHTRVRQVGDSTSFNDAKRFTADTAETTGRAERTIQRDAERGEKIHPAAISMIADTNLDTGVFLDEIKELLASKQVKFVKKCLARKEPCDKKPAGAKAKGKPDLPKLKRLSISLDDALKAATPKNRSQYHAWHND